MIKTTSAVVMAGCAAVLGLASIAEAAWVETWNSYSDNAVPAGDWVVTSTFAPIVDDRLALLPAPPRALDGARDAESNDVPGTIFRAVDPGDTTLEFSWFRRKGNTPVPRPLEIGMYTSADLSSPNIALHFDAQDPNLDRPNEHFESSPGGGSFATTIPANEDGWFDAIFRLLPGGTHALVGWRQNDVGDPYTTSTLPLPPGFAFNYVGISKTGQSGPNGPGSRVENIEVIPEPTAMALIGLSVFGPMGFARRRRR